MKRYIVILSQPTGEQEMKAAAFMDIYQAVRGICVHYGTTDPYFGPQDITSRSFLWSVELYGDSVKCERFEQTLENAVSGMPYWCLEVVKIDREEGSLALKFPVPKEEQKPSGIVFVPAEELGQVLESNTKFSSCKVCDGEIAKDADAESPWYHSALNADHPAEPRSDVS